MSRRSVESYAQHYVYRMIHPSGYYYIGVHSADDARSNKYCGSGVKLRAMWEQYPRKEWLKEIIEIFDRRVDAECHEGKMVQEKELADPLCLNSIRGISR